MIIDALIDHSPVLDHDLSVNSNTPVGEDQLDVNCYLPGSSSSTHQPEWQSMGSSRDDMISEGGGTGQERESLNGGSTSSTATTSPAMSASMDTDEASRDTMSNTMNVNFMDVVSPCPNSSATSSTGNMYLQVSKRIFLIRSNVSYMNQIYFQYKQKFLIRN